MILNAAHETFGPEWVDQVDPPELLIVLAARQMQDMMNAVLRRHELKLVEWRMLRCLQSDGILNICDLSELAVIDRTVASRLVDKLSERGLLKKKALKTDRRFAQVSLSERGRKLLLIVEPDVNRARGRLFEAMSLEEAETLNQSLGKLISNAKSYASPRR